MDYLLSSIIIVHFPKQFNFLAPNQSIISLKNKMIGSRYSIHVCLKLVQNKNTESCYVHVAGVALENIENSQETKQSLVTFSRISHPGKL